MIPMKLDSIYYELIKNKQKLFETRVFDPKRHKMKLLDVIEFTNRDTKQK